MPAHVAARRARLQMPYAMQPAAVSDPLRINEVRTYVRGGTAFVKITAANGVEGWGEIRSTDTSLLDTLPKTLQGVSASAYVAIEPKLPAALASGAVMAMLDCYGKHIQAPVYQVLGGPTRFKVRTMALVGNAAEVKTARAAGHRAFSLELPAPPFPNSGKAYVNRLRSLVDEARAAAGSGCDFVLNCNAQLTAGDASQLAAEFERMHPLWIDEPCRHGNTSALRKIGDESVTPIGLGRHCRESSDFQDLLREETADILRPSLDHFSIARIRKIAALAEIYYIAVAPSYSGGALSTAAALHLAASIPNFFIVHSPGHPPDDPVKGLDLTVRDGYLNLPTSPGLGVTVNLGGRA